MITRSLCIATVLWLCTAAAVSADDTTPPPVSTPAPVATDVVPTAPPVATVLPPTEPPITEPTTVPVAPERSTPETSVSTPVVPFPTARPEGPPTRTWLNPVVPQPAPSAVTGPPSTSGSSSSVPSAGVPPDVSLPYTPPAVSSGFDLTPQPASAQAPVQLTCSPKHHPTSAPFLTAPYSGWTELVSFVDHDQPDYTVDGKIVLANGLTALASDGQASDLFPAYWSPSLRQYVNYDGHNGYDFDISYQPVLAAAAGTVQYAGWNDSNPYVGYGQMVLINHHNGYVTLYGHLSKLEVATGDRVSAGQEIGISGTTGHSSGPHLHFSVFHDCQVTDPYGWSGHGSDPLASFTGDASTYLWLPGHDPLLLNPPPNWPSYPLGLHLSFGSGAPGARAAPPADRLLLLALPSARGVSPLDPGTALARTNAAITAEAEALAPQLDELKSQGVISAFQTIPSAAAVWIHGSASAEELEGLPGVASLTGVQPKDVAAAEAGLAHAVLSQVGGQQAPSLWPVGFRSGLHAWRPVATVLSGQALVAGLALPGRQVAVSLQRANRIPAGAITSADASTGGFVALLHDGAGKPITVRAGDVIRIACDGRTTQVVVRSSTLAARASELAGQSVPGATVSLSVLQPRRSDAPRVLSADAAGNFHAPAPEPLAAGTLVVAGLKDAAGNEQATAAFVPGLALTESSNIVRGWTVGSAPRLLLRRSGRTLFDSAVQRSSDGSFALALGSPDRPLTLHAGDVLVIGSRLHHRALSLPRLALRFGNLGRIAVDGPAGRTAITSLTTASGSSWRRTIAIPPSGRGSAAFPVAGFHSGDRVSVRLTLDGGDEVVAEAERVSLLLKEGTPEVSGMVGPGQLLTLRLEDDAGRLRGQALAVGDQSSGAFRTLMHDTAGALVRIGQGSRIVIDSAGDLRDQAFPRLRLFRARHATAATLLAPAGTTLAVGVQGPSGWQYRQVRIDRTGQAQIPLSSSASVTRAVMVRWHGSSGLTVERTIQSRTSR